MAKAEVSEEMVQFHTVVKTNGEETKKCLEGSREKEKGPWGGDVKDEGSIEKQQQLQYVVL